MPAKKKSLTLRQIAKLAGTSKSTVSRVLTRHPSVSPGTRERIQNVIRKHRFRPNLFARGLAGGQTGLVAVIAAEINSGFYAEVMRGVHEVAGEHEGHLLSCIAHGVEDYIDLWRSISEGGRVDGIVLLAPPLQILNQPMSQSGVPLVFCSCRADRSGRGWGKVDSVSVNNEQAFTDVVHHLVEQGRSWLVHVMGPPNVFDARARRRAFEAAVAGLRPRARGDVIQAALDREDGRDAVLKFLEQADGVPDAFVAFNDSTAFGVLEALRERGIPVPAKVAVTGCDDEPASEILGLTSLHMPMRELGREAARLLFERVSGREPSQKPRHSVFDMTLCVRPSSLKPAHV